MNADKKGCCTPTSVREHQFHEAFDQPVSQHRSDSGMVALPGGRFKMGTDYEFGFPADGEGPVRSVVLSPFSIDITPVTNREFEQFVRETGYVTDAERFNWSFVFWSLIEEEEFSRVVADTAAAAPWWCKVYGASWRSPEGPGTSVHNREDHPVVHVSHHDAEAYAVWAGKQLPTEAEWEYAARGGLEQNLFPWGDDLEPNGEHRCNVWQGEFPRSDSAADGYSGTCPVRAFPPNDYGLYSVVGNVWEWTQDWFGTSHPKHETTDPKGPRHGDDKVVKGGSFLCHASYCNRYRIAARTNNTPDSSTSNIGFRCVRRS